MWSFTRVTTILNRNFASLAYGNCPDLPYVPVLMRCIIYVKSQFQEKIRFFHWEISVSCTTQEYDNVTTPYYLTSSLLYLLVVACGRLKTKENFKLLALKVVAVAYERWSLARGSQCSDLTGIFLVFWKTCRLRDVVIFSRNFPSLVTCKTSKLISSVFEVTFSLM